MERTRAPGVEAFVNAEQAQEEPPAPSELDTEDRDPPAELPHPADVDDDEVPL